MKVLVCGGRDYINESFVHHVLDRILVRKTTLTIIEGGAKGVDTYARNWSRLRNQTVITVPAEWSKYGKRAGYVRNSMMLELHSPDLVVAFPGGRGTDMMVQLASGKVKILDLRKHEDMVG